MHALVESEPVKQIAKLFEIEVRVGSALEDPKPQLFILSHGGESTTLMSGISPRIQ